ncbi:MULTISPECIES: CAP domain-containing protein [Acutalibacteraceae]|uniref:CAP domain-containing protein n=1 Tax=Acutalibacteraceae TaxID=3082771 RepID=UPI001FA96324|nr:MULTISPECIES: CAP domain-containing protein [Acutalibacteraceae]
MKGKLLALLLSLIVSGTAGVYAKSAAAPQNTSETSASSSSVEAVSPVSAQNSDVVKAASQAAAKQTCSTAPVKVSPSANSSSCSQFSKNSAAASSNSAAATASQKSNGSTSSGSCSQNTYCASNSACESTKGNCTQNSCVPGTYQYYCTSNSNCSNSVNSYLNDMISRLTGKTCPSSGSASSSPASTSSKPSSKPSGSSSSSASSGSAATGTYADFQNQVVQLVNQERTSRGLSALSVDTALTKTATLKSQDMAKLGYFDHTSPTYGSPFDMMKQFGISYRTAGENIAMGQTSPQQVMTGWMNSEGHRANILNSSYTKIGVGIAQNSNGQYYWTQQFIG